MSRAATGQLCLAVHRIVVFTRDSETGQNRQMLEICIGSGQD